MFSVFTSLGPLDQLGPCHDRVDARCAAATNGPRKPRQWVLNPVPGLRALSPPHREGFAPRSTLTRPLGRPAASLRSWRRTGSRFPRQSSARFAAGGCTQHGCGLLTKAQIASSRSKPFISQQPGHNSAPVPLTTVERITVPRAGLGQAPHLYDQKDNRASSHGAGMRQKARAWADRGEYKAVVTRWARGFFEN